MSQKKFLDYTGLQNFFNKLKGLIPTKTSELQNDSGFISEDSYDSALSLESEKAVQNKVVTAAINSKQDTLSTAQTNAVDSGITSSKVQGYDSHISDTGIHVTQADKTSWDSKAPGTHTHLASDVSGLSTVATSGSYNDLSNKPSIPSKTSDLTNDSGFLTSHNPVDSTLSKTSTNAVQNKVVKNALDGKSDTGHTHLASEVSGLSTVATSGSFSDLTNKPTIDSALSSTSTNALQNKVIYTELGKKANTTDLATVATSGSYADLTNKPSIPTKTSDLTNDSGFLTSHNPVDSTLSTTSTNAVQNKVVKTALDGKANSAHTHTKSEITDFPTLSTVATSGSYNDLSNKPTIPTVYNKTLTIQQNGTSVATFTANSNKDVSANIVVPTKVSDLTNDSGYLTTHQSLADYSTKADTIKDLSISGKVITYTKGDDTTGTLTTQDTVYTHPTTAGNKHIPSGGSANQFLKYSASGTAQWATIKTSELNNDSGFLTSHNPVDSALSSTSTNAVQNKVVKTELDNKANAADLSTVATSGSYNDLSNKPTIPTVNNATLTIQKNGTTVKTFTANASSNVTANITVPTKVSELTNDSGFLTSASSLDSSKLTGTIDIARLPKGALERLVTVADQTARFALTANDVQLGDTVKQLDTGVMYIVTDESKLSSADGYTEYTAGAATSVPWSGVTGKPSSYTPASHSHGNIANGGTLGTASRALITDGNKKITTSSVTSTELGYLSGVTSAVQTQLNGKAASSHTHTASEVSGLSTVATSGSYNDLSNKPTIDSALSSTSTNAVQNKVINTALAGKAASSHTHTKSQITDFPTKTSQFTNDSHQTITVGTDTTSTATPAHSGTFTCIDSVTRDSNGHVTAVNTKTVTLPADNNTDTKVTNTLGTTTKAYVTGTTSATTNTGTQIFDTGVYLSTTAGELVATKFTGALNGNANTATQFSANKDVTLTGDVTGSASSKAGWSVTTTLSNSGVNAGTYGPSADVTGNNNATISVPEITVDSKGRVTSVANRTLTCKNNTYNVYNKTLTIQKNGTNVATFTSNSNTDVTANITVPTKTSELTNDSGFLTTHQSLSNYVTLNGAQTISATKTWTKSQSFKNTAITNHKENPSADTEIWACQFWSNDNKYWGGFGHKYLTTGFSEVQLCMSNWTTSGSQGYWHIDFGAAKDFSSVYFRPSGNNNIYLGTSDKKWANVYATTFTGNLTGNVTGNVTGNCSGSSGSCTGNAATATQFSANKSVTLTGYVNGTASSKAGWSIATALKNCYFRTGGTVTNTYFKVASGILTGGWNRYETLIRFVETTGNASCTLRVYLQLNGSSLLDAGYVTVLNSVNFGTSAFNVVYKNDTDKTLFEIYFQLSAKNHQVNALVLYETERKLVNSCDVLTMYNDSTPVAALPSDYTLLTTEFELYCGDLVPAGNNKNLGSTDAKWSNVYASTFTGNLTGNVTGNCSGSSASCTGNSATATQFSANKSVTLTGDVTGTASSKAGWSVATTLANSGVTAGTYGPSADVTGNNNATISVPQITVDAKGRVTSVTNRTLTCKNNTYTVNNATLTIQKNGTNVATFTSNASSNVTANITVPTKVSELTNDSGYLTSHQSLSNYVTLNSAQTITGAKTFTGEVIGINKDSSTDDANNLYSTTSGATLTYFTTTNGGTTLTNVPAAVNTILESRTIRRLSSSDYIIEQICHNSNGLYYRKGTNGTWSGWKTFAFTDSNITGSSASCTGNAATATQFSATTTVALTGDATGTSAGSKKGWSVPVTLANSGVTAGTYGPSADVTGNNNATISVPQITVDAKGRVTSVTNRTLTCKNNTYTVNNATLTIQKNGTNVQTFTANQSSNATANITVPTKVSELTNDSGYLTSHQDLSLYPYKVSAYSSYGNGRWPYRDLGDTTTYPNGFNEIVATGKYQIRFTGSTPNSPYTVTSTASDGILEVDGISSSSSVSSYQRVVQRFYKQNSAHIVYFRAASYHDGQWNWSSSWTVYGDIVTHNASEFLTSHQSLSNYSTLANTVKSLSISGKTITVTPGSGSAYTLTTQDTVYTHPTTSGNKHIPSGGSSGQFLGWNSDGTAKWVNNPNTDTLMTQNVSTTNATYPLLLCPTANATANQGAKTSIFAKSVKINPSTNALSATQLWSNSQTIQNSGFTKGTNPSSQAFWSMYISDKNGNDWAANCLGVFETTCDTSGNVTSVMKAVKNEANSTSAGAIAVTYNKSANTVSTYAPTPATSDNSTQIATTAFVKAQGYLTSHQSLANYVTLNSQQYISGSKIFNVQTFRQSLSYDTGQSTATTDFGFSWLDKDGDTVGWVNRTHWSNNYGGLSIGVRDKFKDGALNTSGDFASSYMELALSPAGVPYFNYNFYFMQNVTPFDNNSKTLGDSTHKWANVYATTFTGNVTGNCSGTSANVTGTVAIANGGTGATSRLNAVKALTNENVGTAATYFLGITNSWGKAGYISVADARTVLEIPTFAFQKFAWEKTITLSSMASSSEWEQITGGFKYTANVSLKAGQLTWIYVYLITSNDLIKVVLTNGYILSGKNCVDGGKNSIKADTTTYGNVLTQTVCGSSRLNCLFYPYNSTVTLTMTYTTLAHAGGEDPTLSGKVLIKQ